MGTRNLIAVQLGGEYKIAQYGQWDGYPSGQGKDILNFLESADIVKFKEKVAKCTFLSKEDMEEIDKWIDDNNAQYSWQKKWPHLSRDAGADILGMVYEAENGLALKNSISFGRDSLFCEYAYVIDLDAGQLEVFTGFVKDPKHASRRFSEVPECSDKSDGYCPVKLAAVYSLSDLPSLEKLEHDVDGEPEEES